ncbi:aminotransferase class V-fold PLP-dependent enzyme, partial [Bacteroidota bacterium]
MKRRYFINSLAAVTGGIMVGKAGHVFASPSLMKNSLLEAADDEAYWKIIREQFIFPGDYYYLNTGGIGSSPTLVLNKIETSMSDLEKYPKPGYDHNKWIEIKKTCTAFFDPDCEVEELALIGTATEGINIILNGLPLKKGDEIICTTHEHPALHVPLLNKSKRDGVVLKVFEPDLKKAHGNIEKISKLINSRTRLIFLSHITCTTGQVFPLKEIGNLARENNIWFAVDGAQALGTMPMNIKSSNIDFYTSSGHKWILGPKRTGFLYVRKELLNTLQPTVVGAYSDDGYDILKNELNFQPSAQRYEYGTQNEANFLGLGTAAEFLQTIGLKKIAVHNRKLAENFVDGLKKIPEVEILSPEEKEFRSSIITFRIKNRNYGDLASYLTGKKRIRVRVVHEAG